VALDKFLSPDPFSRSKNDEGRRIRETEDGWEIINSNFYRNTRDEEERERKRRWWQEHRGKGTKESPPGDGGPPPSAQPAAAVTPPGQPEKKPKAPRKPAVPVGAEGYTQAFLAFWEAYPTASKGSKFEAFNKWQRMELAEHAAKLTADVAERAKGDRQWLEGFIPHVSTYINQRIWQSDIDRTPPRKRNGALSRTEVEASNKTAASAWKPKGDLNVE
jgi:hypothetical protein